MNENNKNNENYENDDENSTGKTVAIIIICIILLLLIWLLFFKDKGTTDNNNNNDLQTNIYNSSTNLNNAVNNTIDIADENAKSLYERVKKGITLDGKLIEVPASYMKKITDKVTKEGYKMTIDTKNTINSKLDEIENTLKSEGKTDINELSTESKSKIQKIASDIENLL